MTQPARGGKPSKGTSKDARLGQNKGRAGATPMPGPPKQTGGKPVGAPAPKVKSPKKIK
jgi:hypothetical protein